MQMLIDGEWVDASGRPADPICDKASGDSIEAAPRGTAGDVARAAAAAQQGKRTIAAPSHERAAILQRVADATRADHDALSRLIARENCKTLRKVRAELDASMRIFRGDAEEARRILGRTTPLDSIPGKHGAFAPTMRQPRGVVTTRL